MKGVAAKALGMYEEESKSMPGPPPKDDEYSSDVQDEMSAFMAAMGKKDTAGMARAFKEAHRICAGE